MQSMPTYLRNLYDEALRLQRLISTGRLINAWLDMPRLVRLAQLDRCQCLDYTKYTNLADLNQWTIHNEGQRRL